MSKRLLSGALCAVALVVSFSVGARPGAPIPVPSVSLTEAVELAKAKVLTGEGLVGIKYAKPAEYILKSATYTQSKTETWQWEILFVHPTLNDHSALYAITMDKSVLILEVTR